MYDACGELALRSGERIAGRYENVPLDVTSSWRTWMVKGVFDREPGNVTLYMTDQRMVGIRRPDEFKSGSYLMTSYGAAEGAARMAAAREVLQRGGFEYIEVLSEEVRFYKEQRTVVLLFLKVGDRSFVATVTPGGKGVPTGFRDALLSWLRGMGVPSR